MKGLIVCLSVFIYKHHLQSHINDVAKELHRLEQLKVLLEGAVSIVFVNKDRFLCWHQERKP